MIPENVYTCIVVEDDEIDRLTNVAFVKKYPFLQLKGAFASAEEALAFLDKTPVQVVFLDIDMDGMSGVALRRKIMDIPACIFITYHPEYAVEVFELSALDYLLKPIKADRFEATMGRLQAYLDIRRKAELFEYSLGGDTVFIKEGHDQVKISLQDILYLEALRDYTRIITPRNRYCVLSTLGNLLKEKPFSQFLRIHRSYAVQKHFISRITAVQVFVQDVELPLGRSYRESVEGLA